MVERQPVVGTTAKIGFIVEEKHLAPQLLSGEARVFATPMLVAGMEQAAVELLHSSQKLGKSTVGVHIDAHHQAATPLGAKVEFVATLTGISPNGKKFFFHILAYDEAGIIGEGTHERIMVDLARFEEKAKARKGGL